MTWSCGKQAYATHGQAWRAVVALRNGRGHGKSRTGQELQVYLCPGCGQFHLTKQRWNR